MVITFVTYIFLLGSAICLFKNNYVRCKISNSSLFSVSFLFILIYTLIIGLRYDVGVDYLSYRKIYFSYKLYFPATPQNIQKIEGAFDFIYKLMAAYDAHYSFFYIITAFLNVIFLYIFSRNYRFMAVWIFFFYIASMTLFDTFNQIRQMTAFFMYLCTIKFIIERKFLEYLISVLAISLFHQSILIMLPFYFFIEKRLLKNSTIVLIVLLTVFVFKKQINAFLWDSIFEQIGLSLNGFSKSQYFMRDNELLFINNSGKVGVMHYVILLFDILIITHMNKMRSFYPKLNIDVFYNFFFIGTCLYFITEGSIFIWRISTYFFNFLFVMLSFLMYYFLHAKYRFYIGKYKLSLLWGTMLIVLSLAIYSNAIIKGTKNSPYQYIFEQNG